MPEFFVKAGKTINVDLPARFVFIDSVTDGKSVLLKGKGISIDIEYLVRGGGKLSNIPEEVVDWEIKNVNTTDVIVVLQYGGIFYDENRLDGDINAITKSANLTKNFNEYYGSETEGIIVNTYTVIGLANPLGSIVDLFIKSIQFSALTPFCAIGRMGTGPFNGTASPGLNLQLNKDSSKPNGEGFVGRGGLTLAEFLPVVASYMPSSIDGSVVTIDYSDAPLRIGQNETLLVMTGSTDKALSASFQWFEE